MNGVHSATVTTVEFMHHKCIPPFKRFSSKYKEEDTNRILPWVQTNFHEFQSTARRVHAGCVAILEQYPVAGSMTRCSEPARHITSLLTQHQDRGVRRRGVGEAEISMWQLPGVVNTSARKPQFGPDIRNQLHASAGILSVQIESPNWNEVSGTRQTANKWVSQSPAMPDTPTVSQSSVRRRITRKAEETRQRMKASQDVWPAGGPSLETQFMQFYKKDIVTV